MIAVTPTMVDRAATLLSDTPPAGIRRLGRHAAEHIIAAVLCALDLAEHPDPDVLGDPTGFPAPTDVGGGTPPGGRP